MKRNWRSGISFVLWIFPLIVLLQACGTKPFEPKTTEELARYWSENFKDGVPETVTFDQITVRFRDGEEPDSMLWREALKYPNMFRIDFGPKDSKSTSIYRADSLYVIRDDSLINQRFTVQTSMIMEGGVYANTVEETLKKLEQAGYDPTVFSIGKYKGRKAYIIGAELGDETSTQLWLDAERRCVVRKISTTGSGAILDVLYDDFVNIDGYWIESWVEFHIGGVLRQTERYVDIKMNPPLPEGAFDPTRYDETYWY